MNSHDIPMRMMGCRELDKVFCEFAARLMSLGLLLIL